MEFRDKDGYVTLRNMAASFMRKYIAAARQTFSLAMHYALLLYPSQHVGSLGCSSSNQ